MRPVTSLPQRKQLKYQVWLDMPVGITLAGAPADGRACGIDFTREPDGPEPVPGGTQGRLAIVGIRNLGPAPVSGTDLTAVLGLAFPGRQVLGVWFPASDFLLRPKDDCTVAVVLSGPPAAGSRPARPDGTLASGRITTRSSR